MKNIALILFTLIAVVATTGNIKAQERGLLFNDAKFIKLSYEGYEKYTKEITVPEGMVWKVVSAGVGNREDVKLGILLIDNKVLTSYNGEALANYVPLWLSEGTYTLEIKPTDGFHNYQAFISAIEYKKE